MLLHSEIGLIYLGTSISIDATNNPLTLEDEIIPESNVLAGLGGLVMLGLFKVFGRKK